MFTEFRRDLEEIDLLQKKFDHALGIKNEKNGQILSYNPVLARADYERLVVKGKTNLENFKEYEIQQLKTMLSERYQVMAKPVTYNIDSNGDIYHEQLQTEPFIKILQRGQAYREGVGSKEVTRENGEIEGWLKVFETLSAETVLPGNKMAVISGPGLAENTSYPYNFVDIFTKQDNGSIVMTRFSSPLGYDSYARIATNQKEDYFKDFTDPIDAWFLNNPIEVSNNNTKKTADEAFKDVFGKSKEVLKQEDFEKILKDCMPIIQFYIDILCNPEFKPEELAIAFNAILNSTDEVKRKLKNKKEEKIIYVDFESIQQRIDYLGHKKVQNIKAGCGLSGGFELNSNNTIKTILGNSVAQFGVEEGKEVKDDDLEFKCQNGHWNKREPGKYLKKCKICGCDVSCGIASAA